MGHHQEQRGGDNDINNRRIYYLAEVLLMTNILHIYGQYAQHSDLYIAGDAAALMKLKLAIEHALTVGKSSFDSFQNDGEGYDVTVHCLTTDNMDRLSTAYSWEHAQDYRTVYPWNIPEDTSETGTSKLGFH